MYVYRSYTPTCYYVSLKKNYTTLSECMIFFGPIVPEINYSSSYYYSSSSYSIIPRCLCSFSYFNGVLFRLYVKRTFGFILNTAYLLALKFRCHVLNHVLHLSHFGDSNT